MKNLLTLIILSAFVANASAQVSPDCKNQCKVTRLVEIGVFLGVQITDPLDNSGMNAQVIKVFPKTAAEKSGILVGDIIQKINGVQVNSKTHLVELIQTYKAGDKVTVQYASADKSKKIKVRLGAKSTQLVEEMECCDEATQIKKNAEEMTITQEGMSVFPNPAKSSISIQTKEALEGDVHIMIYTIDGREVYYDLISTSSSLRKVVDVSYFQPGQYFVRVETAKVNYIQKFEVQK